MEVFITDLRSTRRLHTWEMQDLHIDYNRALFKWWGK